MTTRDSRLLRGSLTFGGPSSVGGVASGQITNLIVEQQDGDQEDVQYVLDGGSVGGDTQAGPWHVTGSLIQDFSAVPSLQQWSYQNRETVQPFEFTPNDEATAPHITGRVKVRFLGLGGDVRVRITRDFDWGIEDEPDFGDWGSTVPVAATTDTETPGGDIGEPETDTEEPPAAATASKRSKAA